MATLDRVTPLSTPAMVFSGSISYENLIFTDGGHRGGDNI